MPCLICATLATRPTETNPDLGEWAVDGGTVREASWGAASFPDGGQECRWEFVADASRSTVDLGRLSAEGLPCELRRAPTWKGDRLVLPSTVGFVVWNRESGRKTVIQTQRMTFRHQSVTGNGLELRFEGDEWLIDVDGSLAFRSGDSGETWLAVSADSEMY